MDEILTAAEMAEADRRMIAAGTPGMTLMEAAGRAVADAAAALVPDGPILVVAGPGNNGGDGFVAARRLMAAGRAVAVALLGDPGRLKGDAAVAFERWSGPTHPATATLPEAALVVDALYGAGLDRPVAGPAGAIVDAVNAGPAPVLAVDLPSGLAADTGAPLGPVVHAAATVTFCRKKPAHLLYPGRALCGHLTVADIGIPDAVVAALAPRAFENGPALWSALLRPPDPQDHKYHRGHAIVLSGPMTRTGAARLAAGAALRAGAGLVTVASPGDALAVNAHHLTAVMLKRVDDAEALAALLAEPRVAAVALGPGLGTGAAERALAAAALAAHPPVLLDADALTVWSDDPAALFAAIAARDAPVVLTPHEGEFARLFADLAALPKPEPRPRRQCPIGRGRAPQGRRHGDRRPRRPPRDQCQRAALARHRRLRRRPRRDRDRPPRPGPARLRGDSRRGLAARRRRRRGRPRPHRRGPRPGPPPGPAPTLARLISASRRRIRRSPRYCAGRASCCATGSGPRRRPRTASPCR